MKQSVIEEREKTPQKRKKNKAQRERREGGKVHRMKEELIESHDEGCLLSSLQPGIIQTNKQTNRM